MPAHLYGNDDRWLPEINELISACRTGLDVRGVAKPNTWSRDIDPGIFLTHTIGVG